jgi:hypothetical protein
MLDLKDFSIFENQVSFDFKGFLIKSGVIGSGFDKSHYFYHCVSGECS